MNAQAPNFTIVLKMPDALTLKELTLVAVRKDLLISLKIPHSQADYALVSKTSRKIFSPVNFI